MRSLDDKSTRFVSSRVHQFSHLESIEVYTTRHNVNLVEVLKAMEASKEKLPDDKDSSALKSYFEKVYPELDFDRVYASDLKKMAKWYSVLSKNQVEIKLSEPGRRTRRRSGCGSKRGKVRKACKKRSFCRKQKKKPLRKKNRRKKQPKQKRRKQNQLKKHQIKKKRKK